jgi:hypothetical protein
MSVLTEVTYKVVINSKNKSKKQLIDQSLLTRLAGVPHVPQPSAFHLIISQPIRYAVERLASMRFNPVEVSVKIVGNFGVEARRFT